MKLLNTNEVIAGIWDVAENKPKNNVEKGQLDAFDHAGHLIGDRFGGSKELDNLVSQSAFVNLSEYKKLKILNCKD